MKTYHLEFVRITELLLSDLLDTPIGTYIIWDGRAGKKPTYIGEGNVLARFDKHRIRFHAPIDGYVSLIDDSDARAKKQAEMLEALLLHIASETGRTPRANAADGKWKHIEKLFDHHGVLRFYLSGFDPLIHPDRARPMEPKKVIDVRVESDRNGEESFSIKHDWRSLR